MGTCWPEVNYYGTDPYFPWSAMGKMHMEWFVAHSMEGFQYSLLGYVTWACEFICNHLVNCLLLMQLRSSKSLVHSLQTLATDSCGGRARCSFLSSHKQKQLHVYIFSMLIRCYHSNINAFPCKVFHLPLLWPWILTKQCFEGLRKACSHTPGLPGV